jgi:hypothetical protein
MIDRSLFILIPARHSAGDNFIRSKAQLLSNNRLKPNKRDLGASGQASNLRRKHQALKEKAAIEPTVPRQCGVRCEDQANRGIEKYIVAAGLARPSCHI